MLLNPHPPLGGSATKTGDAGTEDVINRASGPGVPDGALEAIPANRTISPGTTMRTGTWTISGRKHGLGFYGTSPALAQRQPRARTRTPNQQRDQPNPLAPTRRATPTIELPVAARRHERTGSAGPPRIATGGWVAGQRARRTDSGATLDSPEDSR